MIKKYTKPYFIAEIGSNFNQDLKTGYELIDKAKSSGANAVKFQLFKAKKLYPDKNFKLINEKEFYNFLEIDNRDLVQKTIAS